jgi:hypothetical protein
VDSKSLLHIAKMLLLVLNRTMTPGRLIVTRAEDYLEVAVTIALDM